jgi:hypothetical protein
MKIKSARHGSRSSSKGRIAASCPCGGVLRVKMSDHYNFVAICDICGNMRDEHRMPGGISLFEMNKGKKC